MLEGASHCFLKFDNNIRFIVKQVKRKQVVGWYDVVVVPMYVIDMLFRAREWVLGWVGENIDDTGWGNEGGRGETTQERGEVYFRFEQQ